MKQLDLFNYIDELAEMARQYNNEFQHVSLMLRNEAGYAADRRTEARIRQIISRFSGSENYEDFISHTHQLLIELWGTLINGKPSSHLYDGPVISRSKTPRFFADKQIRQAMPPALIVPDGSLIGFYSSRNHGDQQSHYLLYFSDRWKYRTELYLISDRKWAKGKSEWPIYGKQFRIDGSQLWSKEGYAAAERDDLIDPCLPAVHSSYLRFFGRDEVLQN